MKKKTASWILLVIGVLSINAVGLDFWRTMALYTGVAFISASAALLMGDSR